MLQPSARNKPVSVKGFRPILTLPLPQGKGFPAIYFCAERDFYPLAGKYFWYQATVSFMTSEKAGSA